MPEAKNRARILILHYLTEFSLQRRIGEHPYTGSPDMSFRGGAFTDDGVEVGDLVALQSAPASKWYLGWLHAIEQFPGGKQYTIESIEDGELCNWSNVGLLYYDRSNVKSHPEWRWTDAQHEFNGRWRKTCFKDRDAYIYLPVQAAFDGDAVELAVRVRFGLDDRVIRRSFDRWRKVTKKLMLEFYDAASAELAERPKATA